MSQKQSILHNNVSYKKLFDFEGYTKWYHWFDL